MRALVGDQIQPEQDLSQVWSFDPQRTRLDVLPTRMRQGGNQFLVLIVVSSTKIEIHYSTIDLISEIHAYEIPPDVDWVEVPPRDFRLGQIPIFRVAVDLSALLESVVVGPKSPAFHFQSVCAVIAKFGLGSDLCRRSKIDELPEYLR